MAHPGIHTLESDIDLLVELKPRELRPHLGFKWFGLWDELEEILGRKVDLVRESSLSPHIRQRVERERWCYCMKMYYRSIIQS